MMLRNPGQLAREISFHQDSQHMFNSSRIDSIAETVKPAVPGVPFHNAHPPVPVPPYYFEDGQDNYVFLRVQNRGALTGDCTATLYFTDPGMFANPESWTQIGQAAIEDLEPGEFRIAGPIVWTDALIPTSGHYCLSTILDSPDDPAPDLTAIHSSDDFVRMVRDSNNAAWKNITVEDVIPGGSSSWSFYIEGPRRTGHQADLEINLNNFPADATVLVKVVKRLADTAVLDHMSVADQSQVYTTLKHLGGIGALESMDLTSNDRTKVTIFYTLPAGTPDGTYSMRATLRVDGNNTGGYTRIVSVSHFKYLGNRRTREIHRRDCSWVTRMSPYNKIPLADLEQARKRRFDNCAFCIGGSLRYDNHGTCRQQSQNRRDAHHPSAQLFE